MPNVDQILAHTPWWVFLLFAFLVWRGTRAATPAETSPMQLTVLPAVFMVWGLEGLNQHYGLDVAGFGLWLATLAIGTAVGAALLRGVVLHADRVRGVLFRPADFTVLPLVLIAFFSKYGLAVVAATLPAVANSTGFRALALGISGLLAGVFVGKFARYLRGYFAVAADQVGCREDSGDRCSW